MTHLFYRDAAGCLIVFDESRYSTLHGAARWKEDFDTKVNFDSNNPIPCVLVGNKVDNSFLSRRKTKYI
jgi:GTPase SAR1 family protein